MTEVTVLIWPANEVLVIDFITNYEVYNDGIWHPFVRKVGGKRLQDYSFWLEDELWNKLLNFVQTLSTDLVACIVNRRDSNHQLACAIVQRLKPAEVTNVHRAAAVLTVELVRQSPKPTPEVL